MELQEAGCVAVQNPTWDQVEEAVRRIRIDGVALLAADGSQIEAGGRQEDFCILHWSSPESLPLRIGKRPPGARRLRPTLSLSGNRVLVGPYERWSIEEALIVFRLFFDGRDLSLAFDLRNPEQQYSDEEIQEFSRFEPS
jgi:hypothetical protein